jgi:hypothetical protein
MIAATVASVVAAVELGTWAGLNALLAPGGGGAGETMTGALVAAGGAPWTPSAPLGACCGLVVASFATPEAGGSGGDFCDDTAPEPAASVVDG